VVGVAVILEVNLVLVAALVVWVVVAGKVVVRGIAAGVVEVVVILVEALVVSVVVVAGKEVV
jgi:hypothetical protein